jgi:hypothetical protein
MHCHLGTYIWKNNNLKIVKEALRDMHLRVLKKSSDPNRWLQPLQSLMWVRRDSLTYSFTDPDTAKKGLINKYYSLGNAMPCNGFSILLYKAKF